MNTSIIRFSIVTIILISLAGPLYSQNVGISTSGAIPSSNAILDLNTGNTSRNLGFIFPHVALTSTLTTFSPPMAHPATINDTGMMVYNTNAGAGSGVGYYFWSGSTWIACDITANNGLNMSSPTNIQLGGNLALNTNVSLNGDSLTWYLNTNALSHTGKFNFSVYDAGTPFLTVGGNNTGMVGIGVNNPVNTLDDKGSFGNGTIKMAPAASTTTMLTNAYSTIIATPPPLASSYTLALPSASASPRRIYTVLYNGNGLGTINITSPIAGSIIVSGITVNPLNLTSGSVTVQSDGTNWDVTGTAINPSLGSSNSYTFQSGSQYYTNAGTYIFTVPANVTQIQVYVMGGGGGCAKNTAPGGSGGFVIGVLNVTPGEQLTVVVGAGGGGAPMVPGLGGGGGGSYIQTVSLPVTLLCGAGGGGGGAGSSYSEVIGGTNYPGAGYGGGGSYGTTVASLAGQAATNSNNCSGQGGSNCLGYLLNGALSFKGAGLINTQAYGPTFGTVYSSPFPSISTSFTSFYAGGCLLAGSGAQANTTDGMAGGVVILW